jgi:hypothetical protein
MLKKRVIKIRDRSVAMDLHSNQTSASTVVATIELELLVSRGLTIILFAVNLLPVIDCRRFYFSRIGTVSRGTIVS